MGDLIGKAVTGKLYYVDISEFRRVLSSDLSSISKAMIFAALCRINILYMIARAGSGHIGSSFSSIDIMSWLALNEVRSMKSKKEDTLDSFFSSKGHDAPALYNVLIGMEKLDFNLLHRLRRIDGLPGHPDISTPNIVTNTGSLGMGISKAKGMIFANRRNDKDSNIFVLTGDGELQEGQFWESLVSAKNHKLNELIVIIDHNKLQSDTLVSKVSDLGDLHAKLTSFGWYVDRCDGNNLIDLSNTLEEAKKIQNLPKIIIADTIKGKGISFMEHTSIDSDVDLYKFHSGAPSSQLYSDGVNELIKSTNMMLSDLNQSELELEVIIEEAISQPAHQQKLIPAYSNALVEQASKNKNIVALDADLILDTGLIQFNEIFPDRFIECGIAEQDMVSQAGGLALSGALPIVHSFACFLSTRPNEQIYNNATENTKIIYVGSLAGLIPGGPGHSHQSVRDISSLSGIPNLFLLEPSCESEVALLLDWCVQENTKSSYLRLVSVPVEIPYELPSSYKPILGRGVTLKDGKEIVIIGYGPLMLSFAFKFAIKIKNEFNIDIKVINLPWLNSIDHEWLSEALIDCDTLISIDNHYCEGGQGMRIAEALSKFKSDSIEFKHLGVTGVPKCGTTEEVMKAHNFTENTLYQYIEHKLPSVN
jgi:transketolase